ncbi:conserved hypothetical protein [Burkholderiales bacterium 8X]|nr:conserved hypothetical protein [Burkholderiales bacterium 8X]
MKLRQSSAFTRALLCVLMAAVWLATTLGLVHGSLHGAPAMSGKVQQAAGSLARHGAPTFKAHEAHPSKALSSAVAEAPTAMSSQTGGFSLFGAHSDADCRLYDQLSHGAAPLCVPAVLLPVFLPAATFAYLEGEALARWVALFDARGPPITR